MAPGLAGNELDRLFWEESAFKVVFKGKRSLPVVTLAITVTRWAAAERRTWVAGACLGLAGQGQARAGSRRGYIC